MRTRQLPTAVGLCLFVCFVSVQAQERQRAAEVAPREAFDFASAFIDSVSRAEEARVGIEDATGKDTRSALTGIRTNVDRLLRARDAMAPFSKAGDESIRRAGGTVWIIMAGLAALFEDGARLLEKKPQGGSEKDLNALMVATSENLAAIDEIWKLLADAAVLVTHVLVDTTRNDQGKQPYLKITQAERQQLLRSIGARFPELSAKEGGPATHGAMVLFRQFLSQSWK